MATRIHTMNRRGLLSGLAAATLAASTLAAAPADALPADWQAVADQHRQYFPTIEGACREAWMRGYAPDDVEGALRQLSPVRGCALVLVDGDDYVQTEAY